MTEQEMKKLIEEKSRELEKLQFEIARSKYAKHLGALFDPLSESTAVLSVIQDKGLNHEDCRYLGEKLAVSFEAIYADYFEKEIIEKQERRRRKSSARAERAARQKESVQKVETSKEVKKPAEQERAY